MHTCPRTAPWLAFCALLATTACSDYQVERVIAGVAASGELVADPATLAFGSLPVGETATLGVVLTNEGDRALTLDSAVIEGAGDFTLVSDPTGTRLGPGEGMEVDVAWVAGAPSEEALLTVSSPDGAAQVALSGGALYPALALYPDPLVLGPVDPGESTAEPIRLTNTGGAPLVVDSVAVTGEAFTASVEAPILLAAGEQAWVDVTFHPEVEGTFTGTFLAASNAPEATTSAGVEGTTLDVPVAVCSADPPEAFALYDEVGWIGADSYDPGGKEIRHWDWSLVSAPAGSQVEMPEGEADREGFVADMAGTYEAELSVVNEDGTWSESCRAELVAVPAQNLWVEMFWTEGGDDMDLHLVRDGGDLWSDDDCHWENCIGRALDWGTGGDAVDDPSLDIDDIPGTGPENVNVFDPADSIYEVVVHDYPGSVHQGLNAVTVNVYVGGTLAFSDTRSVAGEDLYVSFARIDWEAGTVEPL